MIDKLEFVLNTVKTLIIPVQNTKNQQRQILLSMGVDNYILKNNSGEVISFDEKQFNRMFEDKNYLIRSDYEYFNDVKISNLFEELTSRVGRISNYKFEKIPANSDEYQTKSRQYKYNLEDFNNYNRLISPVGSGKPSSYHGYIVRSIIHFEKMYGVDFDINNPYVSFRMLNGIKASADFKNHNRYENNFFSASLASYERYCYSKLNQLELVKAQELNLASEQFESFVVSEEPSAFGASVTQPKEKAQRVISALNRSASEVYKAKNRNDWKCLYDENHKTFISRTGNDYVEGHHFLPLYSQGSNPVNLDVSENIATLCPTCHALIHYGEIDSKIEMITDLYNKMSKGLLSSGIKTSLEDIIELYKGGW